MDYRQTEFSNGVKLVTIPQTGALSVSILILVDTGAKNEDRTSAGISHFLEHMGFKGTLKHSNSFALTSQFDALGANYNAFTGYDFTGYYVTVIPDKVETAVSLLSDLYLDPIYPSEEIEKEKGVVLEEIKMYEDKPSNFVWEVFSETAFGQTPAGLSILGLPETVNSFNREKLLAYRKDNYLAHATKIVVVGNFIEDKLIDLLRAKFSTFNGGDNRPRLKLAENQIEANFRLVVRPIKQTHFVLGFKSATLFEDDDLYGLNVLAGLLGGGMSSRLFQKIREELGAAYYIGANQNSHVDHGFFAIYAGVDSKRTDEVFLAIATELQRLKTELIDLDELNRAKDSLIGGLFLGLETPSEQTFFYGEQIVLGKAIVDPLTYASKIRAVEAETIRQLAEKIFVSSRLTLALVGPEISLTKIKDLLAL